MFNVWITDWEMECCGEPFKVGDWVQWPAVPVERSEWLERLFAGRQVVVHYGYRAHADDEEEPSLIQISGHLDRIDAVTVTMARRPIDLIADELEVAEGTARLHPVRQARRGRPVADTDHAEFVGYLVMLDG